MKTLPEAMYAAYNAGGDPATANKNFRGDPCPAWEDLPENIRAKWGAVGALINRDFGPVPDKGFTFGAALTLLKDGARVRRAGWNGKGMYLVLVPGGTSNHPNVEGGATVTALPAIGMWTATREFLTGWLASQTDMLADDWEVAE